jgi:hypothetical protein
MWCVEKSEVVGWALQQPCVEAMLSVQQVSHHSAEHIPTGAAAAVPGHACSLKAADSVRSQLARICQRLNVRMVSTPFEDKSYYVNIRKAITAGYFMQVNTLSVNVSTCVVFDCFAGLLAD